MYQDELDVCMACIKAMPHYLDTMCERLESAVIQLRWLFCLNCVIIITLVLTHV